MTLADFVPLYKTIAAVRRSFKRQDHHNNGQIDRWAWQRSRISARARSRCPSSSVARQQCQPALLTASVAAQHNTVFALLLLRHCRYDFYQLLVELELSDERDTQQQLQNLADTAFR